MEEHASRGKFTLRRRWFYFILYKSKGKKLHILRLVPSCYTYVMIIRKPTALSTNLHIYKNRDVTLCRYRIQCCFCNVVKSRFELKTFQTDYKNSKLLGSIYIWSVFKLEISQMFTIKFSSQFFVVARWSWIRCNICA